MGVCGPGRIPGGSGGEGEFGVLPEVKTRIVVEDGFDQIVGISAASHFEDGLVEGSRIGGAPIAGGIHEHVIDTEGFEGVDDAGRRILGDRINGHGGPEAGVANEADGMFFGMIETDLFRVEISSGSEGIQEHAGALEFVSEVGGVNPDQLIVSDGQIDLFFEGREFVAGIFVETDFADAEHGGSVEKLGDERYDLSGHDQIVRFLRIHADVGVVVDEILGRPGRFEGGEVGEVVVEGFRMGAVVSGPEGGFATGDRMHQRHAFVVGSRPGDHVNVRFDDSHCRFSPVWYGFLVGFGREARNNRACMQICPSIEPEEWRLREFRGRSTGREYDIVKVSSMTEQGNEAVSRIATAAETIHRELGKVIVGQQGVIEQIIVTLLAKGHALLVGVPGLGKTLLVKSIARMFSLTFKRIQFTPDLMPADIFGTEVMEEDVGTGRRDFRFIRGPIFANIVLADEINRTPPKTQAALLEAMGERHVTAGGRTYDLDEPFFVLATQNPIELEGTYPLPEAQLDRFLMNVVMEYLPSADEEAMVRRTTSPDEPELEAVFTGEEVVDIQNLVRQVPVSDNVIAYAVRLVGATRPSAGHAPATVREKVKWGAGSRASQALILAGKARALMKGRYNVACEDVRALALPVLRHRVITNFHADAEGLSSEDIIRELLDIVPE